MRAYNIVPIATNVNRPADMRPTLSPKLSRPTARPPRITVKLSQERNVRSLAKKTFFGELSVGLGSRVEEGGRNLWFNASWESDTLSRGGLEEGLRGHCRSSRRIVGW